MRSLLLLAHPDLKKSFCNKRIVEGLRSLPNLTIKDLYAEYPDFNIHVKKEQDELLVYDRIIFQFPLYWYSTPALLKQWEDVVLAEGFAYSYSNKEDYKLKGKKFLLSVTAAGSWDAYQTKGQNTVEELLRPLLQSASYCKMEAENPIVSHEMLGELAAKQPEVEKRITEHINKLKQAIN